MSVRSESSVDVPATPAWPDRAACRGMDPGLFFPERGTPTSAAKAVCRGCPVRVPCLVTALESRERFGIWGGCSERERRSLRRRVNRGREVTEVVAEALGVSAEEAA